MPPSKRRISDSARQSAKAQKSSDLHVPVDALLKEQVKNYEHWLRLGCKLDHQFAISLDVHNGRVRVLELEEIVATVVDNFWQRFQLWWNLPS